jgi:AcrR family transcriptional regulator
MVGIHVPLTKRGQETFLKLYRAAEHLFHEQSYHRTTIADIAKHAGVAVGTFYLYAEDKYALFKLIMNDYSRLIRQTIGEAIKHVVTRKEKERLGIKAFIMYVRDNPHIYTVIWQSLQVDKSLFIAYYRDFARHYQVALQKSLDEHHLKDAPLLTLAYMLMGVANFVGLQVIMFEDNLQDDMQISALVDSVILMLEQGLFTQ